MNDKPKEKWQDCTKEQFEATLALPGAEEQTNVHGSRFVYVRQPHSTKPGVFTSELVAIARKPSVHQTSPTEWTYRCRIG